MPTVIANWYSETSAPRTLAGATSEMYSGATTELKPMPMPTTNRPASRTPSLGVNADTIAPTKKMIPADQERQPPADRIGHRSGHRRAQDAADQHDADRELLQPRVESEKSLLMNRMAPEITPVS